MQWSNLFIAVSFIYFSSVLYIFWGIMEPEEENTTAFDWHWGPNFNFIVDEQGHKQYIGKHCGDTQIDLTKARRHQSVCFEEFQYIVQTATQGYIRNGPKKFCCLFCSKSFPKSEKAISNMCARHRDLIDVTLYEIRRIASYEVNYNFIFDHTATAAALTTPYPCNWPRYPWLFVCCCQEAISLK